MVAPDLAAARAALEAAGLAVTGEASGSLVVATEEPGNRTRVLAEAGVWLTALSRVAGATWSRSSSRSPSTSSSAGMSVIRLVGVELTRLRWRRAVLVLIGLGVLAPLAVFIGVLVTTDTRTMDDLVGEYGPVVRQEYDSCIQHPQRYGQPSDLSAADTAAACENQVVRGWGHYASTWSNR